MPVTIVRTGMQDDDGTGTTGTVINNAWKVEFYNQIDQALAKVPMLAGANTFTGNQTITGILNVSTVGQHTVQGNANAAQLFTVINSSGQASATSEIGLTAGSSSGIFRCFPQNWATLGYGIANGSALLGLTAGGLVVGAIDPAGAIKFFVGGGTSLRWTMDNTGLFYTGVGVAGNVYTTLFGGGLQFGNVGTAAVNVAQFFNANGSVGSIQTTGTTTIYATTSDARLKTDRGLAHDTSVLERTEIHEYDWIADGTPGRGVFSQDAHAVAPFANAPGSDERDAEGRLVRPWMTDYSKYVPDLIVGWQQHAAALAAIRAELAALKG
jgi:hypothetical protein